MKPYCFLLTLNLLFGHLPVVKAQNIDTARASVNFEITTFKFRKVKGNFSSVNGNFIFDSNDLSHSLINLSIDINSICTANKNHQKRLEKDRFFDFEKHPKIFFQSDSIVKAPGGYLALGELTINGESKSIGINFNIDNQTIKAKTEISRFDFNMATKTHPRTFPVGPSVRLEITYAME